MARDWRLLSCNKKSALGAIFFFCLIMCADACVPFLACRFLQTPGIPRPGISYDPGRIGRLRATALL
jgi:hypothetical protein